MFSSTELQPLFGCGDETDTDRCPHRGTWTGPHHQCDCHMRPVDSLDLSATTLSSVSDRCFMEDMMLINTELSNKLLGFDVNNDWHSGKKERTTSESKAREEIQDSFYK